jgi:hypothetical protein
MEAAIRRQKPSMMSRPSFLTSCREWSSNLAFMLRLRQLRHRGPKRFFPPQLYRRIIGRAHFLSFGTHIRKRFRSLTALNGQTAFMVAYHLHPLV